MYNTEQKVLIILSVLELGTASKYRSFLSKLSSPSELWYNLASYKDAFSRQFSPAAFDKLNFAISDVFFDSVIRELDKKGVVPVTFVDCDYSEMLRNIYDPPLTLFCKGDISLLGMPSIGIVGSRKCTSYGKRATEWFVSELKNDFCIVSGLANGVDTAAHKNTLECGGKTIAVLAGGIDNIYPANNIGLADEISQKGLLISEFKPSSEPIQYRFPMRNRLISGLAKGVLITEAGEKSGVFSTVEFAAEQGRDAFVIPGDIFSFASRGSNNLLKNLRNSIVTEPKDIIEYYGMRYVSGENKNLKRPYYQPSIEEQKILSAFGEEFQMHFDQIVIKSGLTSSEVNYSLTNLELNDIVTKINTNLFQLNTEAKSK